MSMTSWDVGVDDAFRLLLATFSMRVSSRWTRSVLAVCRCVMVVFNSWLRVSIDWVNFSVSLVVVARSSLFSCSSNVTIEDGMMQHPPSLEFFNSSTRVSICEDSILFITGIAEALGVGLKSSLPVKMHRVHVKNCSQRTGDGRRRTQWRDLVFSVRRIYFVKLFN